MTKWVNRRWSGGAVQQCSSAVQQCSRAAVQCSSAVPKIGKREKRNKWRKKMKWRKPMAHANEMSEDRGHLAPQSKRWAYTFFSRVLATLQPRMLVGWSVGRSVAISFVSVFGVFGHLLHYCSCPNAWVSMFHRCPCPPALDFGSRVSGLVFRFFPIIWLLTREK